MRRLVPNRTSNLGAVAEAYALRASVPRQGHRACGGDVDCLSVVLALTNGQVPLPVCFTYVVTAVVVRVTVAVPDLD